MDVCPAAARLKSLARGYMASNPEEIYSDPHSSLRVHHLPALLE
jgi:hypothetical protein